MLSTRALAAAALMMLATAAAVASPSTLVWIPSTDIQASGTGHITFDNYFSPGSSAVDIGQYGLTVGLDRAELGIDYFTDTSKPWFFNGKILVSEEQDAVPRVVAGLYNWSTDSSASQDLIYILASKTLAGTRLTAGYGFGDGDVLVDDNEMIMLGIDRSFGNRWWGAIDYQGGKSALGALSAGIAYKFSDNASLLVGYDVFNDSALKDTVTLQLDVDFPL